MQRLCGIVLILAGLAAGQSVLPSVTTQQLILPLTQPPQPVRQGSVTLVGNPGPAVYYYWVVARFTIGNAAPAGPFIAAFSPNNLSADNYNRVAWAAVAGAAAYDVLRTATPAVPTAACNCAVAVDRTGTSVDDQSNTLNTYTVSTLDPAGLTADLVNTADGAGLSKLSLLFGGVEQWSIDSAGTETLSGINAKSIEQVRYADQFSGATVTNRVQSAINALSAAVAQGLVVIPSNETQGDLGALSIGGTYSVLDLRHNGGSDAPINWALSDGTLMNANGPAEMGVGRTFTNPATTGAEAAEFVATFKGTAGNGSSYPLLGIGVIVQANGFTQTNANAPLNSIDASAGWSGALNINQYRAYSADEGFVTGTTGIISNYYRYYAQNITGKPAGLTITNAYGFFGQFPSEATNNYTAWFDGPNVIINGDGANDTTANKALPSFILRGNRSVRTGDPIQLQDSNSANFNFMGAALSGDWYSNIGGHGLVNYSGDVVLKSTANGGNVDLDAGSGGIVVTNGPLTIQQGGTIPAAQVLTNNGTINGGTVNATTLQQGGVNAALQGVDINSSNQVTATHSAALNGATAVAAAGRFKLADQGQCTMASGTCTAQPLGSTYTTPPICLVTWTGAGTLTGRIRVAATTSTVTPSSDTGTDTAQVNWACFGN